MKERALQPREESMQADGHESNEFSALLRFHSTRLCTRSILATASTAALVQNIVVRNLAATKDVCYQYLAVPHSLKRILFFRFLPQLFFLLSLFRLASSSNLIFLDEPPGNMADNDYLVATPGDFFCPAGGSW
jgi:hypothetical protein